MWASAAMIIIIIMLFAARAAAAYELGFNWGLQASHRLPPSLVVQMLLNNNVTRIKLFEPDAATLSALAGTNIEVMVAIPNNQLQALSGSIDEASSWVKANVARYIFQGGVNIRYLGVGNEPFLTAYNGSFVDLTFPALQNVQNALDDQGFGDEVKITVPMNADVLTNPLVPSLGTFRNDTASQMAQILDLLHRRSCPFTVNIYPFLSLYTNPNFPQNYLFFNSDVVQVQDGAYAYTNTFDATFDTLVAALAAAGYPDMPIIVGEVGWPTDGNAAATPQNAQNFLQGFLDHVKTDAGTPRRPNVPVFFYLFGLLDEDQKSIDPGDFERHWGVFSFDATAKYPLALPSAGQQRQIVNATGVTYLPRRWCIVSDTANASALADPVSYACTFVDCTELGFGSSCNGILDSKGNASFAFNQFFQLKDQNPSACYFDGTATVTDVDPSVGACRFMVQIDVSASSCSTPTAFVGLSLLAAIFMLIL